MSNEKAGPRHAAARLSERTVTRARLHVRPRVTAGRVVTGAVVIALVAGCIILITAITSGDWQVQPILSGSMRPGLPVGGVVAVQRVPASSLKVRDVVLFHPPNQPSDTYVHRIISLTKTSNGYVIKTQGDANRYPDPWTIRFKGKWAYEARFTVPLIGYAAVWDHSPTGRRDLLLAGGSVIVLVAGSVIVGELRRAKRKKSQPCGTDEGAREDADTRPRPITEDDSKDRLSQRRSERLLHIGSRLEIESDADHTAPLTRVADRR